MGVKTPLDQFIENLQARSGAQLRGPHAYPGHSHTSGLNPAKNQELKCDPKCDEPVTLPRPIPRPEQGGTSPQPSDWETEWRALAKVTFGITHDDPRFKPVMSALASCDLTFEQGDWLAFKLAAAQVRAAVRLSTE